MTSNLASSSNGASQPSDRTVRQSRQARARRIMFGISCSCAGLAVIPAAQQMFLKGYMTFIDRPPGVGATPDTSTDQPTTVTQKRVTQPVAPVAASRVSPKNDTRKQTLAHHPIAHMQLGTTSTPSSLPSPTLHFSPTTTTLAAKTPLALPITTTIAPTRPLKKSATHRITAVVPVVVTPAQTHALPPSPRPLRPAPPITNSPPALAAARPVPPPPPPPRTCATATVGSDDDAVCANPSNGGPPAQDS